jgi:hypothetical protein
MKKKFPTRRFAAIFLAIVALMFGGYFFHKKIFLYGQRISHDTEFLREGEALAAQHCSGCHLLPKPSAHTPRIWNFVLVQMGFKLGLDTSASHGYFPDDRPALEAERKQFLKNPIAPALALADFRKIKNYYLARAEADFQAVHTAEIPTLPQARAIPLSVRKQGPFAVTAVTIAPDGDLWLGEGVSKRLFRFTRKGSVRAEFALHDMPVSLRVAGSRLTAAYIGSMMPSDEKKGKVLEHNFSSGNLDAGKTLAANLFRTAHAEVHTGGEIDIAGFGNTQGEFKVQSAAGGDQVLYSGAGSIWSRRVQLFGVLPQLLLLVAQEKEELILFEKTGNVWRRVKTIFQLPPEAGVTQFHVQDMNHDGRPDIVQINGDDGDLPGESPRAYHGVRVLFQNDRREFVEGFFYNFPGAYRGCIADFNHDGHPDIAVASYYPAAPLPHFSLAILLGQKEAGFKAHRLETAPSAKFITLDCADADRDGKIDFLLGAGNLQNGAEGAADESTIGYFIPNPF